MSSSFLSNYLKPQYLPAALTVAIATYSVVGFISNYFKNDDDDNDYENTKNKEKERIRNDENSIKSPSKRSNNNETTSSNEVEPSLALASIRRNYSSSNNVDDDDDDNDRNNIFDGEADRTSCDDGHNITGANNTKKNTEGEEFKNTSDLLQPQTASNRTPTTTSSSKKFRSIDNNTISNNNNNNKLHQSLLLPLQIEKQMQRIIQLATNNSKERFVWVDFRTGLACNSHFKYATPFAVERTANSVTLVLLTTVLSFAQQVNRYELSVKFRAASKTFSSGAASTSSATTIPFTEELAQEIRQEWEENKNSSSGNSAGGVSFVSEEKKVKLYIFNKVQTPAESLPAILISSGTATFQRDYEEVTILTGKNKYPSSGSNNNSNGKNLKNANNSSLFLYPTGFNTKLTSSTIRSICNSNDNNNGANKKSVPASASAFVSAPPPPPTPPSPTPHERLQEHLTLPPPPLRSVVILPHHHCTNNNACFAVEIFHYGKIKWSSPPVIVLAALQSLLRVRPVPGAASSCHTSTSDDRRTALHVSESHVGVGFQLPSSGLRAIRLGNDDVDEVVGLEVAANAVMLADDAKHENSNNTGDDFLESGDEVGGEKSKQKQEFVKSDDRETPTQRFDAHQHHHHHDENFVAEQQSTVQHDATQHNNHNNKSNGLTVDRQKRSRIIKAGPNNNNSKTGNEAHNNNGTQRGDNLLSSAPNSPGIAAVSLNNSYSNFGNHHNHRQCQSLENTASSRTSIPPVASSPFALHNANNNNNTGNNRENISLNGGVAAKSVIRNNVNVSSSAASAVGNTRASFRGNASTAMSATATTIKSGRKSINNNNSSQQQQQQAVTKLVKIVFPHDEHHDHAVDDAENKEEKNSETGNEAKSNNSLLLHLAQHPQKVRVASIYHPVLKIVNSECITMRYGYEFAFLRNINNSRNNGNNDINKTSFFRGQDQHHQYQDQEQERLIIENLARRALQRTASSVEEENFLMKHVAIELVSQTNQSSHSDNNSGFLPTFKLTKFDNHIVPIRDAPPIRLRGWKGMFVKHADDAPATYWSSDADSSSQTTTTNNNSNSNSSPMIVACCFFLLPKDTLRFAGISPSIKLHGHHNNNTNNNSERDYAISHDSCWFSIVASWSPQSQNHSSNHREKQSSSSSSPPSSNAENNNNNMISITLNDPSANFFSRLENFKRCFENCCMSVIVGKTAALSTGVIDYSAPSFGVNCILSRLNVSSAVVAKRLQTAHVLATAEQTDAALMAATWLWGVMEPPTGNPTVVFYRMDSASTSCFNDDDDDEESEDVRENRRDDDDNDDIFCDDSQRKGVERKDPHHYFLATSQLHFVTARLRNAPSKREMDSILGKQNKNASHNKDFSGEVPISLQKTVVEETLTNSKIHDEQQRFYDYIRAVLEAAFSSSSSSSCCNNGNDNSNVENGSSSGFLPASATANKTQTSSSPSIQISLRTLGNMTGPRSNLCVIATVEEEAYDKLCVNISSVSKSFGNGSCAVSSLVTPVPHVEQLVVSTTKEFCDHQARLNSNGVHTTTARRNKQQHKAHEPHDSSDPTCIGQNHDVDPNTNGKKLAANRAGEATAADRLESNRQHGMTRLIAFVLVNNNNSNNNNNIVNVHSNKNPLEGIIPTIAQRQGTELLHHLLPDISNKSSNQNHSVDENNSDGNKNSPLDGYNTRNSNQLNKMEDYCDDYLLLELHSSPFPIASYCEVFEQFETFLFNHMKFGK